MIISNFNIFNRIPNFRVSRIIHLLFIWFIDLHITYYVLNLYNGVQVSGQWHFVLLFIKKQSLT